MPADIRITGRELADEHRRVAEVWAGRVGDAVLSTAVPLAPMAPPLRGASGRFRSAADHEHVPGTLRRSGHRRDPQRAHGPEGEEVFCDVVFGAQGSGAEEYAAWQHEHVEAKHTDGAAKYLSVPAKASALWAPALLAQMLRDRQQELREVPKR